MNSLRWPILVLAALTLFAPLAAADGPGKGRRAPRYPSHSSTRAVWVPGHFERVERRVWVPGGTRREWIPPVTRRVCNSWGVSIEVVVRPGRWVLVPEPGRYEVRCEEVWIPGAWTYVPC